MLAGVDLRKPTPDSAPESQPQPIDLEKPVTWRVDRRYAVAKVVGAALFALFGVVSLGDPGRLIVGLLAAVVLGALALRDLLAPVRVAADPGGVTVVAGFAGHRRLPWSQIERIRVDERNRLTLRSQLLELDTGDNLYLYSASELSSPVAEVAARLNAFRARYAP
jgi:hypothetical protein